MAWPAIIPAMASAELLDEGHRHNGEQCLHGSPSPAMCLNSTATIDKVNLPPIANAGQDQSITFP